MNEDSQSKVRNEYSQKIKNLILGPGSENISRNSESEIISENPKTRYVSGILYSSESPDSDDTAEVEKSGDAIEDPIAVDNNFRAISMGITFYCKSDVADLEVNIKTARYNKIPKPFLDVSPNVFSEISNHHKLTFLEFNLKDKSIAILGKAKKELKANHDSLKKFLAEKSFGDLSKKCVDFLDFLNSVYYKRVFYTRTPHNFKARININRDGSNKTIIDDSINNDGTRIEVFDKVQSLSVKNLGIVKAITIVIKNLSEFPLFQSQIIINQQNGIKFYASEDIKIPNLGKLTYEDAMNVFLYRNCKTYATGHGVSGCWKFDGKSISSIFTSFIPSYEILPISTTIDDIDASILDPTSYIGNDYQEQLDKLSNFIEMYRQWIDKTKAASQSLQIEFQKYSDDNINNCYKCLKRMHTTLNFLKNNLNAFKAFNIANETILLQRMDNYHEKENSYETKDYSTVHFHWRPFQLAFILNSLESVLNPKSEYRNDLDLIWVPTGGGKTEAYLFAISAVIAYRRLTNKDGYEGVTVIMRYTLRLLTSQQFERASKMICALEYIRRNYDDHLLGDAEISIGLWIGGGTENHLSRAKSDFKAMMQSHNKDDIQKKNKFQLLTCPWCNQKHSLIPDIQDIHKKIKWGYKSITNRSNDYNMCCMTKDCPFNNGLPVYVVDESIYKVRPTLIFGTVDKFAQVPLNESAQHLFGSDDNNRYHRPDLIVQDELHLISGPLGSIVGLYEAGFDYIFHDNSTEEGPKYIASTATIRNAEEQVKGIFDRRVQQFPPQGITSSDNYFIRDSNEGHGRKYFGIMGTGKSQMTVEVHILAAMLQCAVDLGHGCDAEELYWTIAGYFNSLRELGKASTLLRDDVRDYLRELKKRLCIPSEKFRELSDFNAKELTSRIEGNQIPEIIKELEIAHRDQSDFENKQYAVDTLLATNMLSVGIDISRLNAMLVVGQPKLTSEYIQATSRVGRKTLGAVFTLYNSTRSRDRSHYETFQAYHQSLYKYVEPSSVTPFSVPAMKRGIPGVMASMLRNTVEQLSGDKCPINVLEDNNKQQLKRTKKFLIDRVKNSEDKYHLYQSGAQEIINNFINKWQKLATKSDSQNLEFQYFKYPTVSDQYTGNLLLRSFNDNSHKEASHVMESMRNVDDVSFVNIREDEEI